MLTDHWTNMHGCTIGSKVLSCIGITSTRPIMCFVLISMPLFSVPYSFKGIIHFKKPGRHLRNTHCITQITLTTWHNPWVLTGDDHLMIIVWSSDCHLIAIRWSLLRPVWYHGWIVAQSSDHDAVAGVSVVTLVALLTLGTFGNHASAPPETQHKSSAPPVLDLTSASVWWDPCRYSWHTVCASCTYYGSEVITRILDPPLVPIQPNLLLLTKSAVESAATIRKCCGKKGLILLPLASDPQSLRSRKVGSR